MGAEIAVDGLGGRDFIKQQQRSATAFPQARIKNS
jgi:hypothetical protein